MSTYSGNSLGKCLARMNSYNVVQKEQGRRRFNTGKHIVIASRYCGDIAFLVERGIETSNIIACDIDPQARDMARTWKVALVGKDIVDTTRQCIEWYGKESISTINIDLCCTVKTGAPIVSDILSMGLAGHTRVMFTFFKARDGMRGGTIEPRIEYLQRQVQSRCRYKEEYQSNSPMGSVIF